MASSQPSFEIQRSPSSLKWPGGRNVAVVFNIAYEVWDVGASSGVGPMGNPLPPGYFDPNADSYGRYGATAGIQRLMRCLDRAAVTADIFTSGRIAETDPDQLRAVVGAGHHIVAHGYAQNLIPAAMSDEDDARYIAMTTELLTEATGQHPGGWISPRATAGPATMQRLIDHGYTWQGDVLDDDLPYLQTFSNGELVAVPLSIEFNDLSHSMRFGRTAAEFIEVFDTALAAALARPDETIIFDVLVHCHCYGRPAGAWAYEEIARRCAGRDDIWVTHRSEIAQHFRREGLT